ncbi:MAG: PAS domain S-box protein [Candidatus Rokubacteria bacterium]|nr:PAS domain S-box protein [Candidatus Rokubacteria bacterium]
MTTVNVSGLRVRLLLLVLLAILPASGLILYTVWEQRRQATMEAQEKALQLATVVSTDHERWIEAARQLLTGLARLPEVRRGDSRACSRLFADLLSQYRVYANLGAIDPTGNVFCSALPLTGPVSVADRPYFRRAMETRAFAGGEYQVGRITGKTTVNFGYPVSADGERVQAVVFAALDLGYLNDLAATAGLPPGSTLTLIGGTGVILTRYPDPEPWVGKSVPDAPLVKILLTHGKGVAESAGLDGVPRLYAFVPLRGVPQPAAVYVGVGIPTQAAYGAANRVLTSSLIGLGIVGLVVMVATRLFADRSILRPVNALVGAARRLASGDLAARAGAPYRQGELGQLARAFDEMAVALGQQSSQIREAEAQYRALVEQSLVGVYLIAGNRFLYVNQAMAGMFGYEVNEVIGRLGPMDLVHPDDRTLVMENLRARLSGQAEALRYVFRGLRKDGTTIHCEVFGRRIPYQGTPAVLGSLVDISERVRSEEGLRKVNRALRVLSAGNMVLIHARRESDLLRDVCRTIVEVGGYRLAWVGFAEDDEGKTVRPVAQAGDDAGYLEAINVTWADTERGQGPMGVAIRSGRPCVVKDILADRAFIPWRAQVARLGFTSVIALPLSAEGKVLGGLAIYATDPGAFDSEEVKLLAELAGDLAFGITVLRTRAERAKAQEELQRQREALLQSEKLAAMGQLLAGVAHELNNPLSVITGHTAILRQTGGGPLAERAEKIAKAAERCARIVKNFLALARQQPPERSRVELNRVVREAVELLAYPLRVDNVEVTLDLAEELPALWADPHQLHQVVVNLVSNAHHAMRDMESPRRLTLATSYEHNRGWVNLEVRDTGPGIPPEIQRRIFEPFFTTKPVGQGTGLGLSLCRGIVEGHGGIIRVESQPGQGALFVVELPAEAPPRAEPEAARPEAQRPIPGKTILVVDDEPEVAGILAELLAADGHQVETAANGLQALDKLRERRYDLILSDLRMPGLDGPGLYRELERRDPRLLRRVIFLTGDTLRQESQEFLERAGVPSLTKPFDAAEVRRLVQQALAAG